ncbi:DNA-binding transcriptional MerR regulator [Actinomadura coerulea]|uniref:DNA-binding transcriptional MerR regulator n=1 Tax=Actinomadura coerulea TaxID=46159 RepID=A0A7X0KYM5_9ACTN|nr:MerR family transcriptional regulator [Actinomadura coerulea]MBB6395568.1 DNA-binding transcriptional MerR regulator [Actinomadura coerulea]GGQ25382.1 transcriptional regulator [Actinomadura coerulea]
MDDVTGGEAGPEMSELGVAEVARRLGVAPSTLRTWDRQYGVGPTGGGPGRHHRYTQADIARLETMQQMISAGAPPTEAAEAALHTPHGQHRGPQSHSGADSHDDLEGPATGHGDPQATRIRNLADAAMAMDELVMTGIVESALRYEGVTAAWEQVVVPVLVDIGSKHAATGKYVEVEHLLSAVVSRCLLAVTSPQAQFSAGRIRSPVVLACAPEEEHALPVLVLAAALAETGAARLMLGARVPASALAAAVARTGAHTVFVWSQTSETGDPSWLTGLHATHPALQVVVGGPGWNRDRLPPEVPFTSSVSAALGALLAAGNH